MNDKTKEQAMTQEVFIANRLNDGLVVFLTAEGGWSEWIADAALVEAAAEKDRLTAIAAAAVDACRVVDPLPIEVTVTDGAVVPVRLRERIRAQGPTVHTDHGKQAEARPARAA
jgi:hypothetical protein